MSVCCWKWKLVSRNVSNSDHYCSFLYSVIGRSIFDCRTLRISMTTWLAKVSCWRRIQLSDVSVLTAIRRDHPAVATMPAQSSPTIPKGVSACHLEPQFLNATRSVCVVQSVLTVWCSMVVSIAFAYSAPPTAVDGASRPCRRSKRVRSSWNMLERYVWCSVENSNYYVPLCGNFTRLTT